jgi:hypothetical protein
MKRTSQRLTPWRRVAQLAKKLPSGKFTTAFTASHNYTKILKIIAYRFIQDSHCTGDKIHDSQYVRSTWRFSTDCNTRTKKDDTTLDGKTVHPSLFNQSIFVHLYFPFLLLCLPGWCFPTKFLYSFLMSLYSYTFTRLTYFSFLGSKYYSSTLISIYK